MHDETELARRQLVRELNTGVTENKDARRAELEQLYCISDLVNAFLT